MAKKSKNKSKPGKVAKGKPIRNNIAKGRKDPAAAKFGAPSEDEQTTDSVESSKPNFPQQLNATKHSSVIKPTSK